MTKTFNFNPILPDTPAQEGIKNYCDIVDKIIEVLEDKDGFYKITEQMGVIMEAAEALQPIYRTFEEVKK